MKSSIFFLKASFDRLLIIDFFAKKIEINYVKQQ